jgi:unsaturated rhamnogalacturonyl hydrolase
VLATALLLCLTGLLGACGDDGGPGPAGDGSGDTGSDTAAPDTTDTPDTQPDDTGDPGDSADDTAGSGDTGGDTGADTTADTTDTSPDTEPFDTWEPPRADPGFESPITASDAYLARQVEYRNFCATRSLEGAGGMYGQVCVVANGQTPTDERSLASALEKIDTRGDTADFRANALARLLYLNDRTGSLSDDWRTRIETSLLGFKYWINEPGEDGMAYWTENHQILFHTLELLMGQRFPDTVFGNSGMTGAEHVAHATPRLLRWLELRGRYGFSEWHSNVYYNEDIPALVNLVDFSQNPEIAAMAAQILDVLTLDFAQNLYRGLFATTHGRTYSGQFVGGLDDSTAEASWLLLGLGGYESPGHFSASFLSTSRYAPPAPLETLAHDLADHNESRQHDSFDLEDGPRVGVGYEGLDDVVVWAGLSAIVAPEVIDGAIAIIDEYDLWDGFLFGSLPDNILNLLKSLMGGPGLRGLANQLLPLSRGMCLEGVDTYVYRTPDYQLAGAQDYKPGMWSAQTQMWQATLDADIEDITIDDMWIGGWMPRVTLDQDAGIIQYRSVGRGAQLNLVVTEVDHLLAYFPTASFDETRDVGSWKFGRKGDGYLALWSQNPMVAVAGSPYEWRVAGNDNVFVVQMGRAADQGSFDQFVTAVSTAELAVTSDAVTYASPSRGRLEVGWQGPMTRDGAPVDLGPYPRFAHPNVRQDFGSRYLDVTTGGTHLRWDFVSGTREQFATDTALGPLRETCDEGSGAVCFAALRDPASEQIALARAIADKQLSARAADSLGWDWGEAVMMVGLMRLFDVTGDVRYRQYVADWMNHHIADGYEIETSDSCAPAALAVALLRDESNPGYQAVVADALDYLGSRALRSDEGGLNHHGIEPLFGVSLWVDSLFMFGNVMTTWGAQANEPGWLDEYARQFGIFTAVLQDNPPGFYRHAAHSIFRQDPDVYWGRGNGWVSAAAYDHLAVRRMRGERVPQIEVAAKRLVDAARATQDPASGLWWTVMNRPGESYLETSAAALFAYGMARGYRYGFVDASVLPSIEAAMRGVTARIVVDPEGVPTVTGVSGPTSVGTFDYYATLATRDDVAYGIGAVLLALTETSGLE